MNTLAPRTKARMDDFPEDDSLRGIILPDAWEGFSYGEVLEGYRTKQGLGLRKVAEAMGIYPSVLSRYENNQRGLSFDTADAFAAAIGVDPLEL